MLFRLIPWFALAYMGIAWGLGFSIAKLATNNGATPIGLAFWQSLLVSPSLDFLFTYLIIFTINLGLKYFNYV